MTTNQKKQKKTSKLIKLDKITKRSDYLRASKSKYVRTNSFVIQFYNRNDTSDPRYGITATKKIGNAIKLVDRLEFSRNNFNAGKPGAKK